MHSPFALYTQDDRDLHLHDLVTALTKRSAVLVKPFETHEVIIEGYYLFSGMNGLELWRRGDKRGVVVDERAVVARATYASDLAKACGLTKSQKPEVVDVMAGFGVDGTTLALLGARVECWEQLPGIALMARDLLYRCGLDDVLVRCLDSWHALADRRTDVFYLDPMFELAGRTALAAKRMQYLECLAGSAERRVVEWIHKAVPMARNRVVVKRHLRDKPLPQPDWQIVGKKVRFDVYRGCSGD